MFFCKFCDKFSLLIDEQGFCRKCYSTYSKECIKFIKVDIPKAFEPVDDTSLPIEKRKQAVIELKDFINNFLNTTSGAFCMLYDPDVIKQIKYEADIAEYNIDETIEVLKEKERMRSILEQKRGEKEKTNYKPYAKTIVMRDSYSNNTSFLKRAEPYNKVKASPDDYVVFDLETTGLDKYDDKILEIGAIKYIDNQETERFHTYVNPQRSIPRAASEINGITQAKVKKSPLIAEALVDFLVFIEDLPLIAYNSDFDMNFLQINCNHVFGNPIDNDVIDALPLAREYLSELPNKKLETVKNHFNLAVGSHNALDDCYVTNHLYQYCKKEESLFFKYIIPFKYNPAELNEKEELYLNEIVKICETNEIKKTNLSMYKSGQYLIIKTANRTIATLKLNSKLQYVLLEIPYTKFVEECETSIKSTAATKGEGYLTRIFPTEPEQLWEFQKYIAGKRKQEWTTN